MSFTSMNDAGTLFESVTQEIWERPVLAADNSVFGYAVAEVIEPENYAVRYLVVYNPQQQRRLLLPATYVVDAHEGNILCNITPPLVSLLPEWQPQLSRAAEVALHQQLGCPPYWQSSELSS